MAYRALWAAVAGFLWLAQSLLAAPVTVVVISDLNSSYGSTKYAPRITVAIERIIEMNPDLVISSGDMVAGQRVPQLGEPQVREMWAAFHRTVSDPLAQAGIPLAVTPGNHDASGYSGFLLERDIFRDEWLKRKPDLAFLEGSDYPFFYGFDLKGVRFISLDATIIGPLSGNQNEGIARYGNSGARLTIAFSHLPLWGFAQQRETQIIDDPDLARLFQDSGVGLHLSGHHHAFYPGFKDGVAYVGQAALGNGPRKLVSTNVRDPQSFTVVTIQEDGSFEIYALAAPDFTTRIDFSTLPSELKTYHGTLQRLDLAR
ncbi:MAG: metallophosphoesterase [Rhodobacteraceae bacterium]|nr:metallophosphoesterase [Paracoccaceae bacterium]